APKNICRFCQGFDFMHPVEHRLICGLCVSDSIRRRNSRRDVFHGCGLLESGTGFQPVMFHRPDGDATRPEFLPLHALLQEIFSRVRELSLRVQNARCFFLSCSELPPPMIIALSRGWAAIPSTSRRCWLVYTS